MSIFQNLKESNLKKKYFTTVIYIYRYNCISIYTSDVEIIVLLQLHFLTRFISDPNYAIAWFSLKLALFTDLIDATLNTAAFVVLRHSSKTFSHVLFILHFLFFLLVLVLVFDFFF